jgi:hypothetical protein
MSVACGLPAGMWSVLWWGFLALAVLINALGYLRARALQIHWRRSIQNLHDMQHDLLGMPLFNQREPGAPTDAGH